MGKIVNTVLLLGALSVFATGTTQAANAEQNKGASSKAQAAQIAKQRHSGKVLKVQYVKGKGAPSYRVKLLTEDGTVKVVSVSAKTKE